MIPLTRSGSAIAVLAVASYLGGWQLGWNELMVSATGCGLALLLAGAFVAGRHQLSVTRTVSSNKVTVGDHVTATLTVTNPRRTPIAPVQLEERCGRGITTIDIGTLAGGATTRSEHQLDTARRGVLEVGPAVIARMDPLGLMRRESEQAGIDLLWVQPRVVSLTPVPAGFAKDLEGPTSDTSPAGDVSFHTLREYEVGDDHRHVHWLSTARTGTLMVRQYVDNRRPEMTVVIDTGASPYESPDEATTPTDHGQPSTDPFELAVEVAASLVVNAQRAQQPVTLRCGLDAVPATLDSLTVVQPDNTDLTLSVRHAIANERATSVMVIVTGPTPAASLLAIVEEAKRSVHVIVIRCCHVADAERLPSTTTLTIDSLEGFQAAWNAAI